MHQRTLTRPLFKPLDPIPRDGGWTLWSEWTECDRSCGGGRRERLRTCTNPVPQFGGESCRGLGYVEAEIEMLLCNEIPCPSA